MLRETPTFFAYHTPLGTVTIGVEDGAVSTLVPGDVALAGKRQASAASNRAATQVQEYLAGKRRAFDVPLAPRGSDFQLQVWRAIDNIPYGQTATARDLAERLGRPQSYRAVGTAVRQNPLPLLIPAHRVVGAAHGAGSLAGDALSAWLLRHEQGGN